MDKKKKRNFITVIVIVALIAVSFYFDKNISQAFSSVRTYLLNQFFLGIKLLDTEIFVAIFLTIILLFKKEKREWIFPLWLTILITGATSFILKYAIKRPRPFMQGVITLLPGLADKASYHIWDFSFPSFDTALAFCAVPIVWKFFPRFRYVWLAFSILVGLSRIYFGVHFMSDVLAGGLIGFLIGTWIIKIENKNQRLRKFWNKIFKGKF